MPTIDEVSDRVKLINALEESRLCLKCDYCFFIRKLKNRLQELNFFTTNANIEKWLVQYKDSILKVEPIVESSLSLDQKSN